MAKGEIAETYLYNGVTKKYFSHPQFFIQPHYLCLAHITIPSISIATTRHTPNLRAWLVLCCEPHPRRNRLCRPQPQLPMHRR